MKMKPVGCNVPSRPAPWSWLNVFKESACKEKQRETDLIPIKPNGNPGEKDNKVPGERLLQYNVEIFKSALSYPDSAGDNLEFRSGKTILLLQEILQSDLNSPAWILLSLSCSHSGDTSNSWALLYTSGG